MLGEDSNWRVGMERRRWVDPKETKKEKEELWYYCSASRNRISAVFGR